MVRAGVPDVDAESGSSCGRTTPIGTRASDHLSGRDSSVSYDARRESSRVGLGERPALDARSESGYYGAAVNRQSRLYAVLFETVSG
jgi:hypothetical protein